MSLRRPNNLTFEAPAEVFVGETARLELDIARAPQGLQGKIDWPDGLGGDADFAFFPAADGAARAEVACRAVRRGVWRVDHLWLFWRSRLKLLEFVPKLAVGAEIRVVPNIRMVQSG